MSAVGVADYSKVVVRPARKSDAFALSAFFTRAWKEAGPGALGFTGATDESINAISSEEFLSHRLSSLSVRIVVAELDRTVLGFASIRVIGKREGELSGVVVLESASGRGLGTKLVRRASETAGNLGLERLTVKTEAANQRAIRFYKKSGFTESGRTSEKVGRVRASLMILEKKLRRPPRRGR
jgi:ribosomal protein S18 acetylase RimI-like enzyme